MSATVDALSNLLEQTTVKKENKISIKGQSRKFDTKEDAKDLLDKIKACTDLQTLELTGNTFGVEACEAIAEALSKRPEFEKCLWADMFTGRLRAEIPKSLTAFGKAMMQANCHIVELDLSDNAFGPDCAQACVDFLHSPSAYTLKDMKFNNNGLGGGGVILANALLECHKRSSAAGTPLALRLFIAGRNRLENPGAKALANAFKTIGTLEEIHLPQNGIQHQGIAALAECVRHSPKLSHINLNDNTFTAKGAVAMADAIRNINSLKIVNFGDCLIRTDGAVALGKALKDSNPALETLICSFGEVRVAGGRSLCDAVKDKEHMKVFDINGNQFGDEGCEELSGVEFQSGNEILVELDEDEGDESDEEEEEDDDDEEGSDADVSAVSEVSVADDNLNEDNLLSELTPKLLVDVTKTRLCELMRKHMEKSLSNADKSADAFMKLTCLIPQASLVDPSKVDGATDKVFSCLDMLMKESFEKYPNTPMFVINPLFVNMGLMKCENKNRLKQTECDVRAIAMVIGHICRQPYFPAFVKTTVRSVIARDNKVWSAHPQSRSLLMQQFYAL